MIKSVNILGIFLLASVGLLSLWRLFRKSQSSSDQVQVKLDQQITSPGSLAAPLSPQKPFYQTGEAKPNNPRKETPEKPSFLKKELIQGAVIVGGKKVARKVPPRRTLAVFKPKKPVIKTGSFSPKTLPTKPKNEESKPTVVKPVRVVASGSRAAAGKPSRYTKKKIESRRVFAGGSKVSVRSF